LKTIIKPKSELAKAISAAAANVIRQSINESGRCRLVLTGGGLGMEVLASLASSEISWRKVTVIFSDERFVGPRDADRNEHRALERLPHLKDADWLRYPDSSFDLETSTEHFNEEVASVFGVIDEDSPTFDLVLLGMGPDGHVASLFPGRLHSKNWIVSEDSSPKPPISRMSLSYEALCKGERVWFIASGKEKAAAAKSAMTNSDLPAGRVRGKTETVWWIDQELSDEL
jgi:6-phosphogluconolactonase